LILLGNAGKYLIDEKDECQQGARDVHYWLCSDVLVSIDRQKVI